MITFSQPARSVIVTLSLCLASVPPALAQTSAVVGQRNADGSFQVYRQRFQPTFADGTPVARVEIRDVDGFVRVARWAADGCRGESTLARIGIGLGDGPQPVIILTSQPLELLSCEDRGCAEQHGSPHYTTACGRIGDIRCACVKKNDTGDNVIIYTDGTCALEFRSLWDWRLDSWIRSAFLQ
jgi:hypothetical protein